MSSPPPRDRTASTTASTTAAAPRSGNLPAPGPPSPPLSTNCSTEGAPSMPTDPASTDVAVYAAAIRAELAGLAPTERDTLLEDLEDHLAEVAAESDATLTERLGSPAAYAA